MALSVVTAAALLVGVSGVRMEAARYASAATRIDIEGMQTDQAGDLVLPDGSKMNPFDGLEVEAVLERDAFECHHGRIMAIRMPATPDRKASFNIVRLNTLAPMHPTQVFNDLADKSVQFLLFPPMADLSTEWRLLFSRLSDSHVDSSKFVEQRLFQVSRDHQHPCGVEGESADDMHAAAEAREDDAAAINPEQHEGGDTHATLMAQGELDKEYFGSFRGEGGQGEFVWTEEAGAASEPAAADGREAAEAAHGLPDIEEEEEDEEAATSIAEPADDVQDGEEEAEVEASEDADSPQEVAAPDEQGAGVDDPKAGVSEGEAHMRIHVLAADDAPPTPPGPAERPREGAAALPDVPDTVMAQIGNSLWNLVFGPNTVG